MHERARTAAAHRRRFSMGADHTGLCMVCAARRSRAQARDDRAHAREATLSASESKSAEAELPFVALDGRENDVDHPEEDEQGTGGVGDGLTTAQFGSGLEEDAAREDDADGYNGADGEDGDREAEAILAHDEGTVRVGLDQAGDVRIPPAPFVRLPIRAPVYRGDEPRQPQPEEDVDRVGACHVADRVVGRLVTARRLYRREGVG
mmetsp:Transcript_28039/g.56504  ORF Transcript_28039/g.56504 Transcript_28039/m.56504 type:complete len:206 (-) Transcript_28039:1109-1726(-)